MVEVGRDAVERPRRRVALVAAHAQPADLLAEVARGCPGRAASAGPASTPSIGSVNRYWWAIGMIGTVTPASRPISGANMPPALTTTSASIVCALAARARPRRRSRGRARRRSRRPACAGGSWRHGRGRRPRAPGPARTGRASRRSAARPRRGRRRASSAGTAPGPPRRVISSSGRPNVFAQPAWRWSSSNRSFVDASRSEPTSCHDDVDAGLGREPPVQVGAVHHHPGQGRRDRSWPTSPAEWNVEPDVSSARSTSTTSRPAELGEVIRDRRPADAAADDHRPRVLDHRDVLLRCPPNRRPEA